MQFSTTNQATTEVFRQGSGESTFDSLMKNELFRKWHKLGFAILVIVAFALGCILPLWYSGNGWISNQQIQPHLFSFYTPGLQFGSQTVFCKKGETIRVKVDIHEIKDGGLLVRIVRRSHARPYVRTHTDALMTVSQATEKTLTMVADQSAWYHIEFEARNLPRRLRQGYAEGLFSAEWEVN